MGGGGGGGGIFPVPVPDVRDLEEGEAGVYGEGVDIDDGDGWGFALRCLLGFGVVVCADSEWRGGMGSIQIRSLSRLCYESS